MSKFIPRKIKKACKNITLAFREYKLVGFKTKQRLNTKWRRKDISFIIQQEKLKLERMDEWVFDEFMSKFNERKQG